MTEQHKGLLDVLFAEGFDVKAPTETHVRVYSKFHKAWINFYPTSGKFNLDSQRVQIARGLKEFVKFVKGEASISAGAIMTPETPTFKIKYKKLRDDAFAPYKKYVTDAGFDIACVEPVDWIKIAGLWQVHIKSGIAMEVPKGMCLITAPRSSTLFKHNQFVFTSVIDSGYTGELTFIVQSASEEKPPMVQRGDRVAQVLYIKVPLIDAELEEVINLPEHSPRGSNGFGSTGRNMEQHRI